MSRYIDAEILPSLFDEEFKKTRVLILNGETHLDNLAEGFLEADRVIKKLPTADVAEVKHGHWKLKGVLIKATGAKNYTCSVCGCDGFHTKFCPECGAKMDESEGVK